MDEFYVWNEDKIGLMFGWSKTEIWNKKGKMIFVCLESEILIGMWSSSRKYFENNVWIENDLKVIIDLKIKFSWKMV